MKHFITVLFLLTAISISPSSYASGCSLTKSLYDTGKFKQAFKTAQTYSRYKDSCADFYLGLMYLNGEGVKSNTSKGNDYIQKAAQNGYQPAIDYLNSMVP